MWKVESGKDTILLNYILSLSSLFFYLSVVNEVNLAIVNEENNFSFALQYRLFNVSCWFHGNFIVIVETNNI